MHGLTFLRYASDNKDIHMSCFENGRSSASVAIELHCSRIKSAVKQRCVHILYYNIPRACLLNRSPVSAMVLKSNRSGLWRTCVAGWDDYVANTQTMSQDVFQLSHNFCRATWVPCRVGVKLCCDFYIFRSYNRCTFRLLLQRSDIPHNFCCRPVYHKTLILWNSYFESIKMTSQA